MWNETKDKWIDHFYTFWILLLPSPQHTHTHRCGCGHFDDDPVSSHFFSPTFIMYCYYVTWFLHDHHHNDDYRSYIVKLVLAYFFSDIANKFIQTILKFSWMKESKKNCFPCCCSIIFNLSFSARIYEKKNEIWILIYLIG